MYINEQSSNFEWDKNRARIKYCPCGKSNRDGKFAPFVGYDNKGYCHSCGNNFLPELSRTGKQPKGISSNFTNKYISTKSMITNKSKSFSVIPVKILEQSLHTDEDILQIARQNNFVKFLIGLFGKNNTSQLISRYLIGTSTYQFRNREFPNYECGNGATVFWQIDSQGKIRTGKIMLYNRSNGKRVKEPFNHIYWIHKEIQQPNFVLKQCLFGEHLLQDKTKPVAITESEKTAIIASMYLPQFIWLATGSLTELNAEKCQVLKGRTVILFPDLNGFDAWRSRAKELSSITRFKVFDQFEREATDSERKQGLDLADYLANLDYLEFVLSAPQSTEYSTEVQPLAEVKQFKSTEQADCNTNEEPA